MNDVDELRSALQRLAERPGGSGASEVFARATAEAERQPARSRPLTAIVAVAAAMVMLGGVVGWAVWPDGTTEIATAPTVPDAATTDVPADVVITGGDVQAVAIAFGRVWVASGDGSTSRLQVFDRSTGEEKYDVVQAAGDDPVFQGSVSGLAVSDSAVWMRTRVPWDEALSRIYQIDPQTFYAMPTAAAAVGLGPLVAAGNQVASADSDRLTVLDDRRDVRTDLPLVIDAKDVLGRTPDLPGEEPGFSQLWMSEGAVLAYHRRGEGLATVALIDPATGSVRDRLDFALDGSAPAPRRGEPLWWIEGELGTSPGVRLGVTWEDGRLATRAVSVLHHAILPGQLDDGRIVTLLSSNLWSVVSVSSSGDSSPMTQLPDWDATSGVLLLRDRERDRHLLAEVHTKDSAGRTRVSFHAFVER